MKDYINKLPPEIRDIIFSASDISCRQAVPAYLVGGFVRDLILKVKDFDLDIVVEGDGIKFAEDLGITLKARLIRHKRFGTATLMINHRLKVDIATARRESYPEAASLPVVIPSNFEDDLIRRDFTINAMAINISKDNFGEFVDLFGGINDLRNGKVRVLHDLSFIDDPTRMLRAVRFEKRYGFSIEPKTLRLLKEAVKLNMLDKVQPQRNRDELVLLLKENNPKKHIIRVGKLIGFKFIHPKMSAAKRSYELLGPIESEIEWFQKNHAHRRQIDAWLIYFMGLVDHLNTNCVKSICEKFMFRKGEDKRILDYKKLSRAFISDLSRAKIKPSRIYSLLEPLSYEVILLLKAKYKNARLKRNIDDFLKVYNDMRIHISGDDLYNMGLKPGPHYQKIFRKVLEAKLNGVVKTKEEELSLIASLIKER